MKGSVTNKKARKTATRVLAQLTPSGLDGPYRLSNTRPATMVGSANGMSETMFRDTRWVGQLHVGCAPRSGATIFVFLTPARFVKTVNEERPQC